LPVLAGQVCPKPPPFYQKLLFDSVSGVFLDEFNAKQNAVNIYKKMVGWALARRIRAKLFFYAKVQTLYSYLMRLAERSKINGVKRF